MSATTATSRPATSKPRGICKYYATERGCFNGRQCKFLHGETATHTPYDQAKTCRFYAAGFCKRGPQCWFSHTKGKGPEQLIDDEDDLCSICFEKPITYGLLTHCNHVFCITCIKQWRSSVDRSLDLVESGNTKCCPMCRTPAKFIIPSSKFYAHGQAAKDAAISRYMDSMKKIPCKYFQRSLAGTSTPFCHFGKDCFYQHRNSDGSDHIATHGVDSFMRRDLSSGLPRRSDLIRSLENVFAETARLGLTPPFHDDGLEEETAVMRRLELLADQMLTSLAGQGIQSDSEFESSDEDEPIPPLEAIPGLIYEQQVEAWRLPFPSLSGNESDEEMPALASVSSSGDDASLDTEEEDLDNNSGSDDRNRATDEHVQAIRPFDLEFTRAMAVLNENPSNSGSMLVRLSNLWRTAAPPDIVPQPSPRAVNAAVDRPTPVGEEGADYAYPVASVEHELQFVTDGGGRDVWGLSSDSESGSSPRHISSLPNTLAFDSCNRVPPTDNSPSPRQSHSEGGFTTDGRGRVIGTTGAREGEYEAGFTEESGETNPQRSFLGRMLDALF